MRVQRAVVARLPEPFHVDLTLHHARTSSFGELFVFPAPKMAMRALRHPDGLVAVMFDFTGKGVVRVAQVAPERIVVETSWLEQAAWKLWGLGDDVEEGGRVLSADSTIGALARRFAGLHLLRAQTPLEALQVAVLGQQVSVAAARSIRQRVRDQLGEAVTVGDVRLGAYPIELSLLKATGEELRKAGVSAAKARTLSAAARAVETGVLRDLEREASEIRRRLTALPGVGPWTCEVVMMRGFHDLDAFPASDLGLLDAAKKLLQCDSRPSPDELERLASCWSPWRAYAALYLWVSLNPGGA